MSDHAAVPPSHVPVHRVVADVTERVIARSRETRTAYLSRISQAPPSAVGAPPAPTSAAATSPTPSPPAVAADRAALAGDRPSSVGDRHVVQRHALGARAVRDLPPADQGGGRSQSAGSRGSPAASRRCATASRRAGRAWSSACSAATSSRCPTAIALVARRVRRRADARRLRQDRARAGRGRARASATCRPRWCRPGRWPSGLPNAEKAAVRRAHAEGKVGRDGAAGRRGRRRTTRRAPAPSTAPPTPTSC